MAQRTNKLAGALSRQPRIITPPGTADQNGKVSIPENKPQPPQNLQRVSPGVYRNAQGDLTDMRGKVLQRPAPQPQQTDWQSIINRYQPMQRPGEMQSPQDLQNRALDAANNAAQSMGQMQPPPNVPMQTWEQMQNNPGPRPAMQTPYDRWRFATGQAMGAAFGNQAAAQINPYHNAQIPLNGMALVSQGPGSTWYGNQNNPGQSAPQQPSGPVYNRNYGR